MTYKELQNKIAEIFGGMPTVASYRQGDAHAVYNTQEVEYMAVCALLDRAEMDGNTITYIYNIYAADRLVNDLSNTDDVWEHGLTVLETGLNALSNVEGILEIERPRTYNFARQEFSDVLGVVFGEIRIQTRSSYGECSE